MNITYKAKNGKIFYIKHNIWNNTYITISVKIPNSIFADMFNYKINFGRIQKQSNFAPNDVIDYVNKCLKLKLFL